MHTGNALLASFPTAVLPTHYSTLKDSFLISYAIGGWIFKDISQPELLNCFQEQS